jgi:hypothetical protein
MDLQEVRFFMQHQDAQVLILLDEQELLQRQEDCLKVWISSIRPLCFLRAF